MIDKQIELDLENEIIHSYVTVVSLPQSLGFNSYFNLLGLIGYKIQERQDLGCVSCIEIH